MLHPRTSQFLLHQGIVRPHTSRLFQHTALEGRTLRRYSNMHPCTFLLFLHVGKVSLEYMRNVRPDERISENCVHTSLLFQQLSAHFADIIAGLFRLAGIRGKCAPGCRKTREMHGHASSKVKNAARCLNTWEERVQVQKDARNVRLRLNHRKECGKMLECVGGGRTRYCQLQALLGSLQVVSFVIACEQVENRRVKCGQNKLTCVLADHHRYQLHLHGRVE